MGVPNRDKLAQIQCLERDTGGEEEEKRGMEVGSWLGDKIGVPRVTRLNYKPSASIFGLS